MFGRASIHVRAGSVRGATIGRGGAQKGAVQGGSHDPPHSQDPQQNAASPQPASAGDPNLQPISCNSLFN